MERPGPVFVRPNVDHGGANVVAAGKVVKINGDLANKPEAVNADCYAAWMIAIAPADPKAVEGLMDSKAYGEYLKTAAH